MIVFCSLVIILYSSHTRYHRNIIIAGGDGNGYRDDILEDNPDDDSMVGVGRMTQARASHAVSVAQAQDDTKWCQ